VSRFVLQGRPTVPCFKLHSIRPWTKGGEVTMRDILFFASLVGLSVACSSDPSTRGEPRIIGTAKSAIIGGELDSDDPSVIELLYALGLPPSGCGGDSTCLQTCHDGTGQSCASGADCLCGLGAECTGELVGPHSVLTAGHCTDLTAGGTLAPNGPALTLCTSPADVMALLSGTPPSTGCTVAALAIFNNRCTTTDTMESCEVNLIQGGDYIIADQVINPGFTAHVTPPYSSTNNDHDIGLVHLTSTTLQNGGPEPGVLVFNRADLGSQCNDLGDLKSVGYGITQPSQGSSALSGLKYAVTHDEKVKDTWHLEAAGSQPDPSQTCGVGTGEEPTCEGDSGGPTFNSAGLIVGITSLGDTACSTYGESTRTDAYADWLDTTMAGWGDPQNGTVAPIDSGAADCGVCTGGDSGDAPAAEASAPEASVQAGDVDASAEADGGAGAPPVQSSSSTGGCSMGVSAHGSRHGGALVALLIMASAVVRRRSTTRPIA
jgi:Trypsin